MLTDDPCDHNAIELVQSQILAFDSSMKVQECSFLPLTLCSSKKNLTYPFLKFRSLVQWQLTIT